MHIWASPSKMCQNGYYDTPPFQMEYIPPSLENINNDNTTNITT